MIKIYSGDKTLYLTDEFPFQKSLRGIYSIVNCDTSDEQSFKQDFKHIVNHKLKRVYLRSANLASLWKLFQSQFQIIEAAGGLVKNKKGQYLFIFRNSKWDLPKGKREKGENIQTCAIREVKEECGINGLKIIRRLPTTYHIYSLKGKEILKPTVWFEMECDDTSELIPQIEEGITEAKWFYKSNLKMVKNNTYPSIKDVIALIK